MKKFIILGLVVLFVLLSAQGLYKVTKPARFSSWVKIGGDFIPIWDGRSNLGHPSYWFDSCFVEHGWFNYIQIDSGGYLKLDSLEVDSLSFSKLIGDYAYFDTLVADSIYGDHIVSAGQVDGDSLHSNHIVSDGQISADSIEADHIVGNVHIATDSIESDHYIITVDAKFTNGAVINNTHADTLTITETNVKVDGDLTVSGDVKAGIYRVNLFNNSVQMQSGTQNTLSGSLWLSGMGAVSFDSLIVDSVFCLGYAAEDTNIIDSVYLFAWRSRAETSTPVVIVADGTDWGPSATGAYETHTYTGLDITIGTGNRFGFQFKPDAESAANKMLIYNIILYGHPQ